MSGANGNGNGTPKYFAMLRMELIEHKIGLGNAANRVFYTILRCSLCYPYQRETAIRPTIQGSFGKFVEQLHERIKKQRPVREGDIKEEWPETDHRGEPAPLSWRDLELIAKLSKGQVAKSVARLRSDGLLADSHPFRPIAVPTFSPAFADFSPSCAEGQNFHKYLCFLQTKVENYIGSPLHLLCADGGEPSAQERTAQFLEELCAVRRDYENRGREEVRRQVSERGAEGGVLIERASRAKRAGRAHTPQTPHTAAQESEAAPQEDGTPSTPESFERQWQRLLNAAQIAKLAYTELHLPEIRKGFHALSAEDQELSILGIELRFRVRQYGDPTYTPRLLKYLVQQLWTEQLRPRGNGKPSQAEKQDAARAEFARRLQMDIEEAERG